jgi:hypothetical protein
MTAIDHNKTLSRGSWWIRRLSVAACVVASAYCALWVFSSSDLGFLACNGHFSLFARAFTCRLPYVAAILCLVFALSAAGLLLVFPRKRPPLDPGAQ